MGCDIRDGKFSDLEDKAESKCRASCFEGCIDTFSILAVGMAKSCWQEATDMTARASLL